MSNIENNVILQAFEWYLPDDGNYYKELKKNAADLKKAGFNAVWLPPMFKATGTNDVGYGVYDIYDLGEFEQKNSIRTKYGLVEELKEAIDELHKNNILVYADVVLNHKAGADFSEVFQAIQVDENDRNIEISEAHDIEGWTGFSFPGRAGKYSEFQWNFSHFSGVDFDQKTGTNGIFKVLGNNKSWNQGVSNEKGNFDYLMFADLDLENEDVKNELFNWSEWFVKYINIDGIRFDALKHMPDFFIKELVQHIEETADRELYFFGEYWVNDREQNENYLAQTDYKIDLFDVVLHYNMYAASVDGNGYDLRKIFDNSLVKENPSMAVTFVDNHDSQPKQSLESFVQPWFKKTAYGLILLRKDGYPCVFYGDYCEIKDPYIPGNKDLIDNLLWIRKNYAYGEQTDYFNDAHLIGWVRHGNEEHKAKLAVVVSSGDMAQLTMNVGKDQAGKTYIDLTSGNENEVVIDEEGNGLFQVGPGTLAAWAAKEK